MPERISERWMVPAGEQVQLDGIDPASRDGAPGDKEATEAALPELRTRLAELQDRLWAEEQRALLVVLQAMDGGGKDGTIRHVFKGLAPQATHVTAFKAPTELELAHDFLWRIHMQTPGHGEIGIFNRSHYEDVLVTRVYGSIPEHVWLARYGLINAFEEQLTHGGTTIVKFFLHISRKEQRKRFEERLQEPDKRWKFRHGDLDDRARWDEYQKAYQEAISATSTGYAPWYVIPADRKWYRNWAVSSVLVETLEAMDPQYPEPEDLSGIEIE
jgi:PPK2 family polyphosphate:nucleotide phosphotransferase